MQYSIIPSNTCATEAFTHLEQGPDELLDDYLHHASEVLSQTYHTPDMSRISVEGINHYAVEHGFNCRKLKYSVPGHRCAVEDKGGMLQGYMLYCHWV